MRICFYFLFIISIGQSAFSSRLCRHSFYQERSPIHFHPNFQDPNSVVEHLRIILQARYQEFPVSFKGTDVYSFGSKELIFLSSAGVHNYGVYRIKGSKPEKIIKFFKQPKMNIITTLRGNLLASSVGGAKVYSFGRAYAKVMENAFYEGLWFIELEELFPEQQGRIRKQSLKELNSGELEYRSLYYIADQILAILSRNIKVKDPDFMINSKGIIRWFDADSWEHLQEPNYRQIQRLFAAFALSNIKEQVLLSILSDKIDSPHSPLSPKQNSSYRPLLKRYGEELYKKEKLP